MLKFLVSFPGKKKKNSLFIFCFFDVSSYPVGAVEVGQVERRCDYIWAAFTGEVREE